MNETEEEKDGHQIVQDILKEIRKKSQNGKKYVFRGEPKKYCRCDSSLYRKLKEEKKERKGKEQEPDNTVNQNALHEIQKGIIEEAREYVDSKGNEIDILAKVRHYGGFTNLIDFTSNCLIALHFACHSNTKEDGRLIMLPEEPEENLAPKDSEKEYVTYTSNIKDSRLLIQSGVFVHALKGYIDLGENNIIPIKAQSKANIRNYLSKFYNISHKTLFNDLHGFIESQRNRLEAARFFVKGLAHQKKGEYDQAIAAYDEAIELNPEDVITYNNRGVAYAGKRNYDQAIDDFNKAIELNPDHVEAYSNRGNAYHEKGNYDQAIGDFNKAIELNPDHVEACSNRGLAYFSKGDHNQAIADCNKAIGLNPEYAEAFNNRGIVCAGMRNYDQAIDDFNKAVELNPDHVEAYSNRGNAYDEKGNYDQAIGDFNKAIELNPRFVAAYSNRGATCLKIRNYNQAIADFTEAIKLNPENTEVYINRGFAYYKTENYGQTISDLDQAERLATEQNRIDLLNTIRALRDQINSSRK